MNEREAQLIVDIRAGNHESFRALYDLYANYALRTAYGITRNKADATVLFLNLLADISARHSPFGINIRINLC